MKFIATMMLLVLAFAVSGQAQVSVIVNKSVPVSTASASTIADIYTLSTKEWSGGGTVVPFVQKAENQMEKLCSFIGKSSGDLKKTWMRIQLSGEGKAPTSVGSDDEMLKMVASTPGAIGFVDASKVTGDVKVIATIK